jgi:hypothetical protein
MLISMRPLTNSNRPFDIEQGYELQQMPPQSPPTTQEQSLSDQPIQVLQDSNQRRQAQSGRGNLSRMLRNAPSCPSVKCFERTGTVIPYSPTVECFGVTSAIMLLGILAGMAWGTYSVIHNWGATDQS